MTSKMNMAIQKVYSNQLTAGMLTGNFKETVQSFVANNEFHEHCQRNTSLLEIIPV